MLKRTVPEDSVAEYSFTGMLTRPKLRDREARDRAAMGCSLERAAGRTRI
jgi:hypothetical protein